MATTYSAVPTNLKPFEMTDDLYLSVGKIIRAFAEIEDIVTLTVANFAQLSESRAWVLLGKSALASRISTARRLGMMREDFAIDAFNKAFEPPFKEILRLRNALAHGTLLGVDPEGCLCFTSNELVDVDGEAVVSECLAWPIETILHWGRVISNYPDYIASTLQVQELRQGSTRLELRAHRKGTSQPNEKEQPEPPSEKKSIEPLRDA